MTDSKTGIADLIGGRADVAASARALTRDEVASFEKITGSRPVEIILAVEGIGIWVHENNPIRHLTLAQLRKILTGRIRNWKEVGGRNRSIDLYLPERTSELRSWMRDHALEGETLARRSREVATTSRLTAAIARNQGALGFAPVGYVRGTRILRLRENGAATAVWPTRENVANGRYALARRLYLYAAPGARNRRVERFVKWAAGPRGREIVQKRGAAAVEIGEDVVAALTQR